MNRLQARLGLTEFEAVKQMYDGVKKLIEMEKEAEKKGKWAELQPHRKSIAQINTDYITLSSTQPNQPTQPLDTLLTWSFINKLPCLV